HPDASPHRISRRADFHRHRGITQPNLAFLLGIGAEDGAQSFSPAGTDQPRQSENLATAHLKGDLTYTLASAKTLHPHGGFAVSTFCGGFSLRQVMAHHFTH